ncbi:MAG: hypothetical protein IPK82_32970 [Polyangiaceae bacterium]|nr:hypothetical protein [Polyangiaceae bacterium]
MTDPLPSSEVAAGINGLRAYLVITMPDCLPYSAWTRAGSDISVEDSAGYFGDLVRANRQGLKSVGAWSADMQVTIEASDTLVVLRELNDHFVCCAMYDRNTALGLLRLQLKSLVDRIMAGLPQLDVEERPRAVRVIEFLERYAPDPHAVLLRVSTRTGIPLASLRDPLVLNPDQVRSLEETAARILGLEHINV